MSGLKDFEPYISIEEMKPARRRDCDLSIIKSSPTLRGDLMRRLADIRAQIDLLRRNERWYDRSQEKQEGLQRQLAALKPRI